MKSAYLFAAAAVLSISSQANAQDFLGSTVNFQYYFPTSSTLYPFADNGDKLVGPGIEVTDMAGVANMDISSNNILVTFNTTTNWTSASFNGWVLSDQSNSLSAITGVTVNPLTDMAGFSQSNIVWNADTITVNWQGLSFNPNTVFSLDVSFASSVPEPATWAMMLMGFGAIGISMRRRNEKRRLLAV